jgi:hypothetical protein
VGLSAVQVLPQYCRHPCDPSQGHQMAARVRGFVDAVAQSFAQQATGKA